MSQKAITINTPSFADPHITADDDAFIHNALMGEKSGIMGSLICERVSDNAVRLSGGGASNKGYVLYVPNGESEDLTVMSGTQGLSRHDLVFTVVTGTAASAPTDPALKTSDLLSAGDINQVALFRIIIDGTTLTAIEKIAQSPCTETGRKLYVGSEEPAEASEGDLWFVTV